MTEIKFLLLEVLISIPFFSASYWFSLDFKDFMLGGYVINASAVYRFSQVF